METFWNSVDAISTTNTIVRWAVAICGIIAVILTMREKVLKSKIDSEKERAAKGIQLQLDSLKLSLQDRTLPSDKIRTARNILSELSGTKISFCLARFLNLETNNFCNQLIELFESSKWIVEKPAQRITKDDTGLQVLMEDSGKLLKEAELIQSCFKELGFDCKITRDANRQGLSLYIGNKR